MHANTERGALRHAEPGLTVLDDGQYYVELNVNYPPAEAPGFLQRRCYCGVTTPGGYECVGGFDRDPAGHWRAFIDAPYDEATNSDCREFGPFAERMDAIIALRGVRREAHCRHRER